MSEKKYEIVWFGNKLGDCQNATLSLEELKSVVIELAQENEFELVNKEGWIKHINPGEKINVGFSFVSFKDGLSDYAVEALAGEILEVIDVKVYQICNGYKTRIEYTAAIPDTPEDNDQVLYQSGFSGSSVSQVELYIDNMYVAEYGSMLFGKQSVWCYYDDNRKLVEVGDGEDYRIHKEPETIIEAQKLQKETEKEYLYYGDSCWLQPYISKRNKDLSDFSDEIYALTEFVHGSISDFLSISLETAMEIQKASVLSETTLSKNVS